MTTALTCMDVESAMVGLRGLEPRTSSLSGKEPMQVRAPDNRLTRQNVYQQHPAHPTI